MESDASKSAQRTALVWEGTVIVLISCGPFLGGISFQTLCMYMFVGIHTFLHYFMSLLYCSYENTVSYSAAFFPLKAIVGTPSSQQVFLPPIFLTYFLFIPSSPCSLPLLVYFSLFLIKNLSLQCILMMFSLP